MTVGLGIFDFSPPKVGQPPESPDLGALTYLWGSFKGDTANFR